MLSLSSSLAASSNGNVTLDAPLDSPDAVWLNFRHQDTGSFAWGYGVVLSRGNGKSFKELGFKPETLGPVVRLRLVEGEGEEIVVTGPNGSVELEIGEFVTLITHNNEFIQTISFPAGIRAVRLDVLLPGEGEDIAPLFCDEHDCPSDPENGGPTL